MKKATFAAAILAAAFATGCQDNHGWSVSGNIADADGQSIAIEAFNNGNWYVVDSIHPAADGSFKYQADAPAAYPDVMRLSLNGHNIYFPIDSIDHINITASAKSFDTDYHMSGTPSADAIRSLDSIINVSVAANGPAATRMNQELKKELFSRAYADTTVVSIYYLINKAIDGQPLFDTHNSADLRLYGAVAQRFAVTRPNDARTVYFTDTYRNAKAALSNPGTQVIEVGQTSLFEIARYDINGKLQSLKEKASKGNVVVLSFTAYSLDGSQEYNLALSKLWNQHHASGLDIYQISFDSDETAWRTSAANIPWTAVWNATTDGDTALRQYNVGAIPATFIIDRSGSIAARVTNPANLASEVEKYL